jgi:hypothetical protein
LCTSFYRDKKLSGLCAFFVRRFSYSCNATFLHRRLFTANMEDARQHWTQ